MDEETQSIDSESFFSLNNITLKEQNEQLQKEIALLKAQFNDAISMTSNINKIYEANKKLANEVVELKSEREEIEKRYQILMKTNSDLEESIEQHKQQYAQRIKDENTTIQNETNKIAKGFQAQLDSAYAQLSEQAKLNDELQVSQKVVVGQVQRLLDAAAFYFKVKFENVDDLIQLFQQTPENPKQDDVKQNQPNQQNQTNGNGQMNDYEKKIKTLKKKVKQRTNACKNAVKEISEIQAKHKSEVENLQNKISRLQKEKKEIENESSDKISSLRSKVSKLTNDLTTANNKVTSLTTRVHQLETNIILPPSPVSEVSSPLPSPVPQLTLPPEAVVDGQNNFQIDRLNDKIIDLTNKLNSSEQKRNELQNNLKRVESELQKAQIQAAKAESDLNSLRIIHNESQSEIETLRQTLHDLPKSKAIQKNPDKDQLQKYEREMKIIAKKDEVISKLHLEIKQREIQIEDQRQRMNDLKTQIANLEEELKNIKEDYNEYVVKVEGTHTPSPEELIPPSVFNFTKFDAPLITELMKIATNSSLLPASKIDFSFKAIYKHYNDKINFLEKSIDHAMQTENYLRSVFGQFLVDISIAVCGKPIVTIDDLLNGSEVPQNNTNNTQYNVNNLIGIGNKNQESEGKSLIRAITETVNKLTATVRERDNLNSILSQISEILGSNDVVAKVEELKNVSNNSQNALQKLAKKFKLVKNDNKTTIKKFKANETSLRTELDNLRNQYEQKLSEQSDKISKLNREKRKLEFDLETSHDVTVTSPLSNIDSDMSISDIKTLKEKMSQNSEIYKTKIRKLKEQCKNLTSAKQNLEVDLARYKQTQETQQIQLTKLYNENNELKGKLDDKGLRSSNVYEIEKENLKKSHEETVAKLIEQNEKNRKDVQSLVKNLNEKDDKIKELNDNVKKVTTEKIKLARQLSSLKEQLDREKLLSEASLKSKVLLLEAQYKEQLDEMKSKSENERQQMAAYAANAFRSIINNGKLDERSFRSLIDRVKELLNKLTSSDQAIRKMLNVYNGQTTQDAVAQLMYNTNQ